MDELKRQAVEDPGPTRQSIGHCAPTGPVSDARRPSARVPDERGPAGPAPDERGPNGPVRDVCTTSRRMPDEIAPAGSISDEFGLSRRMPDERGTVGTVADKRPPSRRELLGGAVIAAALGAPALADPVAQPDGQSAGPDAPSGLMCELMAFTDRVAISNSTPTFAWIVEDAETDAVQQAYQIQVASRPDLLERGRPDLWDSGRVRSNRASGIFYAGRQLPPGAALVWRVRTWNAREIASPYSAAQLFRTGEFASPRPAVRYPIEHTVIRPTAIVNKGAGHWFLDFGRAAFGRLSLSIPAAMAGKGITVALGEARAGSDAIDPHPGGSVRYARLPVTLTGSTVATPDRVMPFRYAEIEGWTGAMDPAIATQVTDHYPFDDTASSFRCSDPVLNDVWELCKHSIKATSFLGIYIDGDRERKPYEADAYINQLGHYCVDREFTLARYSHEYLISHATWPTEWPLHSVLIAWNDYLYTGDTGSLSLFYQELKAKTLCALAREDGLISTTTGKATPEFLATIHAPPLRDVVDWPAVERDGFQFGAYNTVVNAFHYQAVVLMGRMAQALGHAGDARVFRDKARKVGIAFAKAFYDPARGLYRDGEGFDHYSLHANMMPLAFGLTPGRDREAPILAMLKQKGMACSVYGAQYLLEALYNLGAADHALSLMTSKSERSWAHMLYDLGSTITLEAWDRKFKPNLDWNHAWGAAPANIIPRRLMGITPEGPSPGFRSLSIRPQTGTLSHGEIQLPTIAGPVRMRFTAEPGQSFRMETHCPANTRATVFVPSFGRPPLIDGRPVKRPVLERSGFWRIENVGSGTHRFESDV